MIKVNFKSRILNLIQGTKKDTTYQAFQNIHQGLNELQNTVQSLKLNGENLVPSGSTNTVFAFKNVPSVVNVNGVVQTEGKDYSVKGNFIVFYTPQAPNSNISSHYLGQTT